MLTIKYRFAAVCRKTQTKVEQLGKENDHLASETERLVFRTRRVGNKLISEDPLCANQ
jgi:hypothetical protein